MMRRQAKEMASRGLLKHYEIRRPAWWVFESTQDQFVLPSETEAQLNREPATEAQLSASMEPVAPLHIIMSEIAEGFRQRTDSGD